MSTETTVNIPVSKIFWHRRDNIARQDLFRDTRDEHNLISLLVPGWDGQLGRPVATRMSPEEQAEAVKVLQKLHDKLKSADLSSEPEKISLDGESVTISMPEMLQVFESVYCGKDGEIVVPEYKGATCFRRGNVLLKVNTVRAKRKAELITELPCVEKTYASPMDQFVDNIRENQLKTAGARKMSNADSVGAARHLFQLGATEAKLARAFGLKRGMAQKFHRLCQLDAKHPDLKIVDRILNGEIEAKVFDKEKVKGLLDKDASTEEVATFIAAPNAGNASKIMSRKEIEALAEQCPVELIKLAYQAVLKNDASVLQPIVAKATAINKAVAKVTNG
jgi:hypothetical protein